MSRLHLVPFLLLLVAAVAGVLPAHAQPLIKVYLPLVLGPQGASDGIVPVAATYLGGAGTDALNAAAVAPDKSIVLAGKLPGHNPGGVTPVTLPGGSDGVVVRLAPDGSVVRSITRIGTVVYDMELDGSGRIVACGDAGVAALAPDGGTALWSATPGAATRCAAGSDGTAAVLVGSSVYVYDAAGALLKSWAISGTVNDIAVAGAQSLVIATGFVQVSGNLQHPFIRAWSYDGTLRWKSYDFPSPITGLSADTRGERIAIGRDGKLYFAASINGGTGVSVVSRDPQDAAKDVRDRTVKTDNYTDPTNIGSVKMAWFGRFNPTNGNLELAQSLLTRLSSGRGNSISIRALDADETGNLFIAGDAACCIQNRDRLQFAGQSLGNYESGEAHFLALSSDFQRRMVWTAFAASGNSAGGSPANGVAVRAGVVALAATFNPQNGAIRALVTLSPLQGAPGGAGTTEGYAVFWKAQ